MVKEARQDPGKFAAGEAAEFAIGLLVVPMVIVLCALALFFILGFTTLLGGPMGLFKVLFVLGFFVSLVIVLILRPVVRFLRRTTRRAVDRTLSKTGVRDVPYKEGEAEK